MARHIKVKAEQPTFEQAMHALEEAVAKLEKGDLPLDQALDCFTVGIEGASRCRALLKDVETRVEQLLERADGSLELEPFADGGEDHG
ncbi:MAG: exodeoxyribonuclease VII small subunit [Desulfuromonas sp.]|nr:MAG: exodeoxyribonuclease VII small subunit [Desulfuromonas sp.]